MTDLAHDVRQLIALGECPCKSRAWNHWDETLGRVLAVLGALPKDADGNTLAIKNGPTVLYNKQGHMGTLHLDPEAGWVVWPTCQLGLQRRVQDDENWPVPPEWCYSTPQAAEAGRRAEGGG